MDLALVATAVLMGLAGGPHCAAMCGAACQAVTRTGPQGASTSAVHAVAALHLGRILGYAAAGGVVASSVQGLSALGQAAPMVRPLWTLLHVGAVLLGSWLLIFGRAPAWLSAMRPRVAASDAARPVRVFRTLPTEARAGLVGLAWFIVPCGLLQSALLVSALASSAAAGATVMAAFALGSTLGLALAQTLWSRLRGHATADRAAWPVRAAGALLAGASVFALGHGLASALCSVPG